MMISVLFIISYILNLGKDELSGSKETWQSISQLYYILMKKLPGIIESIALQAEWLLTATGICLAIKMQQY